MTESAAMQEIALPAGSVRYRDSGGDGSPIVFVHGYLVDGRLWSGVVDALSDRYRCLAPDWPLAAHQVAMNPDADLSPPGIAAIIASFLEALDLEDATIVGNDSGGAMSQVLVTRHPQRIGDSCSPTATAMRTSRPGSSRRCRRWPRCRAGSR